MKENTNKDCSVIVITVGRFPIGSFYMTPGAIEATEPSEVTSLLQRHAACDWGDCCEEDWASNCNALHEGGRLFSVYYSSKGEKLWLITEADRSASTLLLPSEY